MGAMFYTCYKTDFAVAIHSYTVKNPTHRLYVMGRRAYCWWTLGTPETRTSFWKVLGARSNIHYIALEEGYLYVFANECPANVKEEDWKACLGRVCQRFNTLYTSVRGVKTSDALFRMYKKDKPNQYGCDGLLTNSILLVRVAKSNSAVGSCMYSFRAFQLNKYA